MPPPVAVTGLGLVLPSGTGRAAAEAVFRGASSVAYLPEDIGIPGVTGAALADFEPPPGTEDADRAVQFAAAAAAEAWIEAGLAGAVADRRRIAVVFPLSKGGVHALADWAAGLGSGRLQCPADPWSLAAPDAAARLIAARLGAGGPSAVPVTACASGGHALVWAARMAARGCIDAAIVGAADASLDPLVLGSYLRMGVLAEARGRPETSVRPFSRTRRGFALGEGAGALVVESAASAARRGARVLAWLVGWATGANAWSLVDVEPGGAAMARLATDAMARAAVEPSAVDYVNAHGSATVANDLAEAEAIRAAFGSAARRLAVSSTKGAHGHLLGAATAVETVLTVLAIERGEVPPTANLTDPDPAIGLDCTPVVARRRPIRHAVKIASGFGGQALALVLSAPQAGPRGARASGPGEF